MEKQLEQLLDLLRQAPEQRFQQNPDYVRPRGTSYTLVPHFDARQRSYDLNNPVDPQWLADLGGRTALPQLVQELRRRGFDVRLLAGREGTDPITGSRTSYQHLALVDNVVSREQTSGAVGIDPAEQVSRAVAMVAQVCAPVARNFGSSAYRPEEDKRKPCYRWLSVDWFSRCGACDLLGLQNEFERAGYQIVQRTWEAVQSEGRTFTNEGRDNRLDDRYGKLWARLDAPDVPGPLTEREFLFHGAVRRFKLGQWRSLNRQEIDILRDERALDGSGWPTDHECWSDAPADELEAWRIGRSTNELRAFQNGRETNQTFGGVRRSLPYRLEPQPRM